MTSLSHITLRPHCQKILLALSSNIPRNQPLTLILPSASTYCFLCLEHLDDNRPTSITSIGVLECCLLKKLQLEHIGKKKSSTHLALLLTHVSLQASSIPYLSLSVTTVLDLRTVLISAPSSIANGT